MECLSYCIANSIDLTGLDNHFKNTLSGYTSTRFRDVLKLSPDYTSSYILFIFKNGTVVSWGIKRYRMQSYIDAILLFAKKPILFKVHDEFSYKIEDKTSIEPHDFFDVDCISLEKDSNEIKLSLSYGFSQSVKLQYFETIIETLIDKYTPMIQGLSKGQRKRMKRRDIRAIIGEILEAKTEMNLISNFLYHPKYFWQHPTLEEYYIMLERYLHIQRRVNAINHRLDTLNDIFEIFNGYLENRHAHNLEIIIIILIGIEILFAALNIHL